MKPYFESGGILIYHGDCQGILPALSGDVDFVLTDPPYLVTYKGRWDGKKNVIHGDSDASWVKPVFHELFRLLAADSFCVSFYGWPHADVFVRTWKEVGFRPVSHLAFVKNVWGLGQFTRGQHETAYLLAKGSPERPESAISDTISWVREPQGFHPNQKPLSALVPLLQSFSSDKSLVLDPFMGSGSTLRAAKECGLRAVGIEIEEKYCELAARRMEQEILFPIQKAAAINSPEQLWLF